MVGAVELIKYVDRVLEGLALHRLSFAFSLAPVAGVPEESVASTTVTRCFLFLLSVVEDAAPAAPVVLSCQRGRRHRRSAAFG